MNSSGNPGVSAWNLPNFLTLLRIAVVPVMGWMLLAHPQQTNWRIATTAVFALAIATDALDGYLARKHNLITNFGKLADPIADKALTGMALVGLSILGELWWWVTISILIREWGITLLRLALAQRIVLAANRGGKLKTVLQAAAIIGFLLPIPNWVVLFGVATEPVSLLLMAAAWVVTMITGVDYLIAMSKLARTER